MAVADILKFYGSWKNSDGTQGAKIQIFGFSRGAAQSVELARALKTYGIEVEFIGLFDPVYSVAKPGQASNHVETTANSTNCNYVTAAIPDNVKKAAVLYAAHEERAWFPATAFTYNSAKTTLIAGITPGNHCDAGGYYDLNGDFQWVSLYWMLEKMYSNHEHDPFAKGLTQAQWNAMIETQVAKVTQNPNAKWYWSDYLWATHLSVPGTKTSIVNQPPHQNLWAKSGSGSFPSP